MKSNNNHTTQDYSNPPMDHTENGSAPLQNYGNGNENIQHTLINNAGICDMNLNTLDVNSAFNTLNTATSMTQNPIFEFYFHLPNDTRIYRVTYSELHPSENIRLLNNGINLSHIPDYQFPHHYNVQSLIRQQIHQRVQQPVQQSNISQMYSSDITDMMESLICISGFT
ncbi:hypothetical protein RclHR1_03510003 [Rhizophagus clarus]|uniref:Uncharacterized protein n=1 Tax=Rhizophagus clarus TaxID=94130 RepID=A0A2Z6RQY0_9GLOM|nr:hypothetical protein RclHR1_03510003 [Rhizophagus clarus]